MDLPLSPSEEHFSCPVCHDIFEDPVILLCSHSFCKSCLHTWWREKQIKECPVCKGISSMDHQPTCNQALIYLCAAFKKEIQRASKRQRTSSESEDLCSLHAVKLEFFCMECQQPVCAVCVQKNTEKHTDHKFSHIDEAALKYKKEVQESLKPLQETLKALKDGGRKQYDQTIAYIELEAQYTESKITEEFEKLHEFLQEEYEARITALREESEQKIQSIKWMIFHEIYEIKELQTSIAAINRKLRAERRSFLEDYEGTMKRMESASHIQMWTPRSKALIDVTKHLGNLTFRVWDKMKDIVSYTPVILDVNTAKPRHVLSDDLTSVRAEWLSDGPERPDIYGCEVPDNAERVDDCLDIVLGSEGFNSGTHSWDVEVGDSKNWSLGVLAESFQRKGNGGGPFWRLSTGLYYRFEASAAGSRTNLSPKQIPRRIRVQLDWNRGELSFSDPDTNTHIHTFAHTFTETVFPFIGTTSNMKILPGMVNVTVRNIDADD